MEQVEKGQVKSLIKALELVDILSRNQAPMTLQELHQTSGYPKSTINSLLSTLRTYGCIRQEADGRYYLGTKLFQWGCGVYASWDITRLARPYLERLAQATGATALLSRVEGSSITVIDQCVNSSGATFPSTPPRRESSSWPPSPTPPCGGCCRREKCRSSRPTRWWICRRCWRI